MVILVFQKEKIDNDFLQCAGWFVRSAQQMNPHGIMTETKMVCFLCITTAISGAFGHFPKLSPF